MPNTRRVAHLVPNDGSASWRLVAPSGVVLIEEVPEAIVRERSTGRPDYGPANDRLREVFGHHINICWFDGVYGSRAYHTDIDAPAVLMD